MCTAIYIAPYKKLTMELNAWLLHTVHRSQQMLLQKFRMSPELNAVQCYQLFIKDSYSVDGCTVDG